MAFYRVYQCGSCDRKFRFLHHPSDAPPPDRCPLCGSPTDGEPVFNPEAPALGGVASIAVDQVYRSMEASSQARMEMAAEVGGGSASDYSALKLTDMADHVREGDTTYKMPSSSGNEVQNFMKQYPQAVASVQPQTAAARAHQGYFPHAGDRSRQTVGNVHASMVGRMRGLGQMNKG